MPWYKRLRWRLIGSQFLVALVGVSIMMLATRIIILNSAPVVLRPLLQALVQNPDTLLQTEADLTIAFRNAVLFSVLFAALGAIAAGMFSSFLLWRTIIAPLRQVADSSQRIADGRFDERVTVPESSGEAMAKLVTSFNQMTATLEEVEQQRVALLGNIAHELRTPLAGLKGYLEGLMDGLFPANEETFAWMSQEADRLSRLVDDIQHLSRIESGQFKLDFQRVDVAQLVQRVTAQLAIQAQSKQISLQISPPAHSVLALADVDRAAQVLINLVGNAIRYTPEGGQVWLTVLENGRFAEISVQDDGLGIPVDSLPYIFERFYRVDQSRSRTSGGTGIGLTISRHLVRAMGGELTAVSDGEGQGSCFTFTLPLA
ncbi:sensor histidine kinase [Candidatus Leptofilum sp.]|uniref:sensor histidine kinase n=1 Tax=Candidatus Leptofilum sp. TaxID=3241576 RepID=UPI003B5A210A